MKLCTAFYRANLCTAYQVQFKMDPAPVHKDTCQE